MAEGWANHLLGDILEAFSAGIETHGLNPNAVKVMAEVGIDISGQKSQHIDEFIGQDFDLVITLCGHAQETCPYFPSRARVVHAGFDDPPKMAKNLSREEDQMECYRKVRDDIRRFVEKLPKVLEE
jgi:arsenate reductase